MQTDIVVGLQYGDEGKGKTASFLAQTRKYDLVCRANGGPNAGHTVVMDDGRTFKLSQLPGATPYIKRVYIGPGCVINLSVLLKEIEDLNTRNGIITVYIHPNTPIIEDSHIKEDIRLEKKFKIGTTKQGIGPCYADFAKRIATTAKSIKKTIMKQYGIIIDGDVRTAAYTSEFDGRDKTILIEGSQGFELDPYIGEYPFVTSSSSHPGHLCASLGIPLSSVRDIYGVAKPYITYVGESKNFTDMSKERGDRLREIGKEYGVVTGRPRRIGEFSSFQMQDAINRYGVNHIFLNKLDIWMQFVDMDSAVCIHNTNAKNALKNTWRENFNNLPIYFGTGPKTSQYEL